MDNEIKNWIRIFIFAVIAGVTGISCLIGIFYGLNYYWLWSARMAGEQELARAEGNRKIAIREATAKKEAAHELAEAEIIRAKGVAEANKIIGDSLKGNDSYLRYLWITTLDHASDSKVIYIPTEANLPILEATRLKNDGYKTP